MTTLSISRMATRLPIRSIVQTLHRSSILPALASTNSHRIQAVTTRSLHNEGSDTNTTVKSNLIDEQGYLQFNTLHELVSNATKVYENNPLFGTFTPASNTSQEGTFQWQTYFNFATNVNTCRSLLRQLNVTPHSKVGIISNNRSEWATIAASTYSLNATLVP